MIRLYRYLFYRLLSWNAGGTPAANAFFFVVVVVWWNALSLIMIGECCFRVSLLPQLSKWQIGLAMAGLALPLYFLLCFRGAVKAISAEFQNESSQQTRVRGTLTVAYIIFSFVFMVLVAIIRSKVLHR